MQKTSHQARQQLAHQKFLLGLTLEKVGLVQSGQPVLTSSEAANLCQSLLNRLIEYPGEEHTFYQLGQRLFSKPAWVSDKTPLKHSPHTLADHAPDAKQRYHHLVRLGGDILKTELKDYSPATLLGGFAWLKQQLESQNGFDS